MKKASLILGLMLTLAGCSSMRTIGLEDQVIARSDNLEARPEWVKESEPMYVKDGYIYMLGQSAIHGSDINIAQAYRDADANARQEIANMIEIKLKGIFQSVQEGYAVNQNQSINIVTETTHVTMSNSIVSSRYWEKVLQPTNSYVKSSAGYGMTYAREQIVYRAYSQVRVPISIVEDSLNSQLQKANISQDAKAKAQQMWDKAVADMEHKEN